MDLLSTGTTPDIFSAMTPQTAQTDSLSKDALSKGIDLYAQKKYDEAIREFRRSIGLAPFSEYSINASDYMAQAYLQIDDVEGAVNAYKNSIQLNPFLDATYISLGNLYFSEGRYEEAEKQFEEAVKVNPSTNNRYSLGQVYLITNRLDEAEKQFIEVDRLGPDKPSGKFGLGQTYSKQGRYEKAIDHFEQAIRLQGDLYDAYAEIGYAYADLGEMDEAQEIVDFLEKESPVLADVLSRYMYKVDPPKIMFAHSSSTFLYTLPRKTPVSFLDGYLAAADTSKSFTMIFQFNKEMDRASVEDRFNWSIKRSSSTGPGEAYNFGQPVPETEAKIALFPDSVYYDADTFTATVRFRVHQNSEVNATIDPSHVEFQFRGKDEYGLTINSQWDQYTGFHGVA
ncbi:MAG: tetratricopeptide repeat protein [Desulfatiglans sp.]|jgi:tetratricopeptide (TPR) repeat protein|nr:tetratricopeptide repeat protein [Thermodesulfobacteriota bacterium]MEE4353631.1 tetratricopeptide repeat protein [Desulfatiglans sp.]